MLAILAEKTAGELEGDEIVLKSHRNPIIDYALCDILSIILSIADQAAQEPCVVSVKFFAEFFVSLSIHSFAITPHFGDGRSVVVGRICNKMLTHARSRFFFSFGVGNVGDRPLDELRNFIGGRRNLLVAASQTGSDLNNCFGLVVRDTGSPAGRIFGAPDLPA
jgi:hypothetical protein